jgi:peptidoglycan/LPS O-acetylase OafA/YrhL
MGSLAGLDTLRFFAAAWVALFHGARFPLGKILGQDSAIERVLVPLSNGLFNGVAAVMLFFVISGFVIHRPGVGKDRLDALRFFQRRLTRVVPPVVIVYLACLAAGPAYQTALSSVLWSLYCEIAYYLVYPLLFLAFRRGWTVHVLILSAAAAAAALAFIGPLDYYWGAPTPLLIVIGFPNWILGCLLAERRAAQGARKGPVTAREIWAWRFGALMLSSALKAMVMHGPVRLGYPESHWLIAVYAFFWVGRELDFYRDRPAPRWSEAAGHMSFSLYLIHSPVIEWFGFANSPPASLGFDRAATLWLAQLVAIGIATALCYLLVEAPFHRLARDPGNFGALFGHRFARTRRQAEIFAPSRRNHRDEASTARMTAS